MERMLAGVATRGHVDVAGPLGAEIEAKAKATGRSSVSRRFKRATEAALAELMARDPSGMDVAVIMIDGLEIADPCCVVALVICTDGTGSRRVSDRPCSGPSDSLPVAPSTADGEDGGVGEDGVDHRSAHRPEHGPEKRRVKRQADSGSAG